MRMGGWCEWWWWWCRHPCSTLKPTEDSGVEYRIAQKKGHGPLVPTGPQAKLLIPFLCACDVYQRPPVEKVYWFVGGGRTCEKKRTNIYRNTRFLKFLVGA